MLVLLIEDDPAIVRFLERGLAAHGHRTISADNGEDGLRMAADESVELILLDIMLPLLDGHQVLQRIRLRRPDLPVLTLPAAAPAAGSLRPSSFPCPTATRCSSGSGSGARIFRS